MNVAILSHNVAVKCGNFTQKILPHNVVISPLKWQFSLNCKILSLDLTMRQFYVKMWQFCLMKKTFSLQCGNFTHNVAIILSDTVTILTMWQFYPKMWQFYTSCGNFIKQSGHFTQKCGKFTQKCGNFTLECGNSA